MRQFNLVVVIVLQNFMCQGKPPYLKYHIKYYLLDSSLAK